MSKKFPSGQASDVLGFEFKDFKESRAAGWAPFNEGPMDKDEMLCLDGNYTAHELEAIAAEMRRRGA